ncbi:MAG: PQQ-dependent sugar dehydrogenase [Verrucomicrobia bacterium]|nr:PQQ-dependent sugar dehydrogenase [Verrucomicrobiota bacterium]
MKNFGLNDLWASRWFRALGFLAVFGWALCLPSLVAQGTSASASSVSETEGSRGRDLYLKNCFACHQMRGQGIPGVFPPLAASDYLLADIDRAIRIVCEGLNGEITVNARRYAGVMPPAILQDEEVASVLNYVLRNWGNAGPEVTSEQVKKVRATTAYPTFEALQLANRYPPLPKAPEGFRLREVARLPFRPVRLTSDGRGHGLYVLTEQGDVWRLDPSNAALKQILPANRYLERRPEDIGGPLFVLGMTLDRQKRLYIASNQQNKATRPYQNIVTIYRSSSVTNGHPSELKPWFQTNYPGSPAYIHAVENIAFGPDGHLYAGNGGRTDGGLTGTDSEWYGGGETPITGCLWRIKSDSTPPVLEVYARGLRNAYGFCWNAAGEMFATENGPDADAPEELNHIEQGKHYGFPYRFADWTKKAYSTSPEPPAGLAFTLPVANLGPDGGFSGTPMFTFDPHSGPGGIVFLGNEFPEGYRGTFLLTRFGNFIRSPKDNSGFDVLRATLRRNAEGRYEGHFHTVLSGLGRPIDIHLGAPGKLYIAEYSRATNSGDSYGPSGRILELSVAGR